MLQYATPLQRIIAYLIDVAIFWVVFLVYVIFFQVDEKGRVLFLSNLFSWKVLAYWVLYFPFVESQTGRTIGKWLMGLRVADARGNELAFWQPFLRHFLDVVDFLFFGLVGLLVMSRSDKNQRVGDKVAQTIVIRHVELRCTQCGVKSILTPNELTAGNFTCPSCGHLND